MERTLTIDERRVLPDGRIYFRRRYSDGSGVEGCYSPDGGCAPQPVGFADMANRPTAVVERMCCEATDEAERAYIESRWDRFWS